LENNSGFELAWAPSTEKYLENRPYVVCLANAHNPIKGQMNIESQMISQLILVLEEVSNTFPCPMDSSELHWTPLEFHWKSTELPLEFNLSQ